MLNFVFYSLYMVFIKIILCFFFGSAHKPLIPLNIQLAIKLINRFQSRCSELIKNINSFIICLAFRLKFIPKSFQVVEVSRVHHFESRNFFYLLISSNNLVSNQGKKLDYANNNQNKQDVIFEILPTKYSSKRENKGYDFESHFEAMLKPNIFTQIQFAVFHIDQFVPYFLRHPRLCATTETDMKRGVLKNKPSGLEVVIWSGLNYQEDRNQPCFISIVVKS